MVLHQLVRCDSVSLTMKRARREKETKKRTHHTRSLHEETEKLVGLSLEDLMLRYATYTYSRAEPAREDLQSRRALEVV